MAWVALLCVAVSLASAHAFALEQQIAAEDLMSITSSTQGANVVDGRIDPTQPPRVEVVPLPSSVAMGLLGLTVCTAGVCRRRRRRLVRPVRP